MVVESLSKRRMAENEVVFRKANEKVTRGLAHINKRAKEEGHLDLVGEDIVLDFYCECSDENCRKRVSLHVSKYAEIHKNRARFVIVPNHEVPSIEDVVANEDDYSIVEKHETPSKSANELTKTDVNNI